MWTNPPKKILARGRVPPFLAMPGFWMHIDPKPTPNWEKQGQWPFHYIERSCNGSDNGFMSPEKCFFWEWVEQICHWQGGKARRLLQAVSRSRLPPPQILLTRPPTVMCPHTLPSATYTFQKLIQIPLFHLIP